MIIITLFWKKKLTKQIIINNVNNDYDAINKCYGVNVGGVVKLTVKYKSNSSRLITIIAIAVLVDR